MTDYIGPTATWWHIAYADRPGRFVYDRAEAIRIAEETGAQFVQERGGDRRIVWEAMEGSEPRRLAAGRADEAEGRTRDRLATDLHDFLFYDGPDGHHVFRFADVRVTCGEDEHVRPLAVSLAAWMIEKGWVAP